MQLSEPNNIIKPTVKTTLHPRNQTQGRWYKANSKNYTASE